MYITKIWSTGGLHHLNKEKERFRTLEPNNCDLLNKVQILTHTPSRNKGVDSSS